MRTVVKKDQSEWYYQIQGWMHTELHLKGVELLAYAYVHTWTYDGSKKYFGGISRLAEFFGVTRSTLSEALKRLEQRGLICSEADAVTGRKSFWVIDIKDPEEDKEKEKGKDIIKKDGKKETKPASNFDFRKELLCRDVPVDITNAWMEVRKRRRAVDTRVALDGFLRECQKAGITPAEGATICAEQGWQSIRASWIERLDYQEKRSKAPSLEIAKSVEEFYDGAF